MTDSQIDTFGLQVLCIDDSRSQLALYREQLEGLYTVSCAETYQEAVAALTAGRPDLILLDMNMPQVTGLEFLDILRYAPNLAHIPVIIVSADTDPDDVKEAFRRGAADYVRKPYDGEELLLRIDRLFRIIVNAGKKERDGACTLTSAQDQLIGSLTDLAAARDLTHSDHLKRVAWYAAELARCAGRTPRYRSQIDDGYIDRVIRMVPLHDIGKVNVPDYILNKDGTLTDREFDLVKKHTSDGARTVDMIRLSFPDYAFLDFARDIILYHHERWDGTGYPEGLSSTAIPLAARLCAIADVFDAVTTNRVYRKAIPVDDAFTLIGEGRGTQFDPDLVDAFLFSRSRIIEISRKDPRTL